MTVTGVRMLEFDLISRKLGLKPRTISCGICGGKCGTGIRFSWSNWDFFRQHYFTNVPYPCKDAIKPRQLVVSLNDTIQ